MKRIMNYQKSLLFLLIILAGALTGAQAQVVVRRPGGVAVVRRPVAPVYAPARRVVVAPRAVVVAPARILVVPPVYRAGVVIAALPAYYTVTYVGSVPYYYSGGVYYIKTDQPQGSREGYEAVMPPVGTVVPSLPDGTRTFQVDGKTYFEYEHVVYKEVIVEDTVKYEVVGYTNPDDDKKR